MDDYSDRMDAYLDNLARPQAGKPRIFNRLKEIEMVAATPDIKYVDAGGVLFAKYKGEWQLIDHRKLNWTMNKKLIRVTFNEQYSGIELHFLNQTLDHHILSFIKCIEGVNNSTVYHTRLINFAVYYVDNKPYKFDLSKTSFIVYNSRGDINKNTYLDYELNELLTVDKSKVFIMKECFSVMPIKNIALINYDYLIENYKAHYPDGSFELTDSDDPHYLIDGNYMLNYNTGETFKTDYIYDYKKEFTRSKEDGSKLILCDKLFVKDPGCSINCRMFYYSYTYIIYDKTNDDDEISIIEIFPLNINPPTRTKAAWS